VGPTTVLICDDSRTYATALRVLLEHEGSLRVVGVSPSGEHAVESIKRLRPSLVTMDLELPGIDGVEAIRQIMAADPVPVLVLSAHAPGGSTNAAAALAAGAVEAIPKAQLRVADPDSEAASALRWRLKLLAQARVKRPLAPAPPARVSQPRVHARTARVIGIGSSTGGPRALRTLLTAMPPELQIPIVVVQHIGDEFLDSFARWLDGELLVPVRVAADRTIASAGVWLAPAGTHLQIDSSLRLHLDPSERPGNHRPSVDVLFESMASALGADAVAVVLTGMGVDGARGVGAVTAAGGIAFAQDEASSVVFGMPRAASERGAQLLPISEIAAMLASVGPPGARL
jgi:two-component system, chemotaxis family, protein-glutamate methylesterase/glutaminase